MSSSSIIIIDSVSLYNKSVGFTPFSSGGGLWSKKKLEFGVGRVPAASCALCFPNDSLRDATLVFSVLGVSLLCRLCFLFLPVRSDREKPRLHSRGRHTFSIGGEKKALLRRRVIWALVNYLYSELYGPLLFLETERVGAPKKVSGWSSANKTSGHLGSFWDSYSFEVKGGSFLPRI